VEHLGEWQRRYSFPWQSDHLSFAEVTSADGADQHAGVAVPPDASRRRREVPRMMRYGAGVFCERLQPAPGARMSPVVLPNAALAISVVGQLTAMP
jgi:hypothetical protein